jgi:hypothetical protein
MARKVVFTDEFSGSLFDENTPALAEQVLGALMPRPEPLPCDVVRPAPAADNPPDIPAGPATATDRELIQIARLAARPVLTNPVTLRAPRGISKSMAKALSCAHFFTGQYLQPEGTAATAEHFLTRTGQEFHAWRKTYTEHLVETKKTLDLEFRERYLDERHLSEDGRKLIDRDTFELDPDSVVGCELFLSADADFAPLEYIEGREPGRHSVSRAAFVWGTIDLLLLEQGGVVATVLDPKSGFSTTGVTDEEPVVYATLVFAHFPLVETVNFRWDFVRVSALRRTSFHRRDDLRWMQDMIRELNAAKDEAVEGYNEGRPLEANPFSGLCPYCQLSCPLRPRFAAGELALAMPQTRADAVRLSQLVKVCEDVLVRARKLVIQWLDQDPDGEMQLDAGWQAQLRVDDKAYYPLVQALQVLGLDLVDLTRLNSEMRDLVARERPTHSPFFDVPLRSLAISGLSDFAKTKRSRGGVSRTGLKPALGPVARRSASTALVIRKAAQAQVEDGEQEAG